MSIFSFGTVRKFFLSLVFLATSLMVVAGDSILIEDGEVYVNEFTREELTDLEGVPHVVVTATDINGDVSETIVVADAASEVTGTGGDPNPDGDGTDPDGRTKRGSSIDNDTITITIPRSTEGPVVLIVDGKVIIVPTR